MSVTVRLPPLLRPLAGGARECSVQGASIEAAMRDLAQRNPAFAPHIFDEAGRIRKNIVFLHDGLMVRPHEAAGHAIQDGDEIVLTNALAGG